MLHAGPDGLMQRRDGMRPRDHASRCTRPCKRVCTDDTAGSTSCGLAPADLRFGPIDEDGSSLAHLRWCGTSYIAVSAAPAVERPQPAGVLRHNTLHLRAQLLWLPCAAGSHAEGAATGRRWLPWLAEAPQQPHPRMLSNAAIPRLVRQCWLGMPRGGPLPGARAGGPSGRAPAAHGPCARRGRRRPASGLCGWAMDGGAEGTADDGDVVVSARTSVT